MAEKKLLVALHDGHQEQIAFIQKMLAKEHLTVSQAEAIRYALGFTAAALRKQTKVTREAPKKENR